MEAKPFGLTAYQLKWIVVVLMGILLYFNKGEPEMAGARVPWVLHPVLPGLQGRQGPVAISSVF